MAMDKTAIDRLRKNEFKSSGTNTKCGWKVQLLPDGHRARVEDYLESVPVKYRGSQERALLGKNKSSAVKAVCQECVGFEEVTARVGNCKSWKCPIWLFRPYQAKTSLTKPHQ